MLAFVYRRRTLALLCFVQQLIIGACVFSQWGHSASGSTEGMAGKAVGSSNFMSVLRAERTEHDRCENASNAFQGAVGVAVAKQKASLQKAMTALIRENAGLREELRQRQ